ncbi:hypothetical protein ACJMK2_013320 [Sinanodonta woodiana]|uniref:AIG1-type G domain-containing protein n=1 Tax=Sinanodonta woodiana TaxID=1069815 RepID=A0ABD3V0B7_SINWO
MHCSTEREGRNKLRLILLGKTGTGMSSLGNFILGRKAFTSKLSCRSVTQTLDLQSAILQDTQIDAVDTPGLYNTEMAMAENAVIIQDSLKLAGPGPHAFILLIQLGRFTDEVVKMITTYRIIFGPSFFHHILVVFTHAKRTPKAEKNINDFFEDVKKCPFGKSLLDECHQRFIFLNMKETNEERLIRKRNTLILMVDKLSENGSQYYADKMNMNMHRDAHVQCRTYTSPTLEQVKCVCNYQEGEPDTQSQEPQRQEEDDQRQKEASRQKERKQHKKEKHEALQHQLKAMLRQDEERRKCEDELRGKEARQRKQDEESRWFMILLIAVVAISTLSVTKIKFKITL